MWVWAAGSLKGRYFSVQKDFVKRIHIDDTVYRGWRQLYGCLMPYLRPITNWDHAQVQSCRKQHHKCFGNDCRLCCSRVQINIRILRDLCIPKLKRNSYLQSKERIGYLRSVKRLPWGGGCSWVLAEDRDSFGRGWILDNAGESILIRNWKYGSHI